MIRGPGAPPPPPVTFRPLLRYDSQSQIPVPPIQPHDRGASRDLFQHQTVVVFSSPGGPEEDVDAAGGSQDLQDHPPSGLEGLVPLLDLDLDLWRR